MKILVVQDRLRSGGTERQSVALAGAFARAGHTAELITFRPGGRLAGTVPSTVTWRVLQPFDCRLDWFAPGLVGASRRVTADVILCMGRMANCYGGTLQRWNPAAAVIGTMRTGKPLPLLFRRSLGTVRHIVANSEEARVTLVDRYRVSPAKISVIYNSLAIAAMSPAAREQRPVLRAQFGASPHTAVLLCVAMFRPEKNQRELIEVLAGLPADADYQLWLAGDGPARAPCEALVARYGLGAKVKFVGFHRDPGPLYAAADLAVHASWSDALSNFVIEAQAHGLPAVVFDAQGMKECCVPGETGWVLPRGDHPGFRQQVLALMKEPEANRAPRSAAAAAFARQRFDPPRQVAKYLELFSLLTTRP